MSGRRRKPTRRDLLIVIGRLHGALGRALAAYENDRDSCRADTVKEAIRPALDLAIEARSYDRAIFPETGPWAGPVKTRNA